MTEGPSWYASGPRLLWFMQGMAYAVIFLAATVDMGGDPWAMAAAIAAASVPASTLQAIRAGKDLAKEYRAKQRAKREAWS